MAAKLPIIFSDYLVLGAGASGLAIASMLAKDGREVCLIEAHSLPGGCASYFKRKGLMFDVGATTLSGIANNGPLKKFLDQVGFDPDLKKISPGLTISRNGHHLKRYADIDLWIDQQADFFNRNELEKFWHTIEEINKKAWNLTQYSKHFPPKDFSDVNLLFFKDTGLKISIANKLFTTVNKLNSALFYNTEFKEFIDEQLLIAAQDTSENVPALMGAMALSYTNDMWYSSGGMGGFTMNLLKHYKTLGGEYFNHQKALDVVKDGEHFVVSTKDKVFKCNKLISSLPLWNINRLIPQIKLPHYDTTWGAVTAYYKVKFKLPKSDLYHQVQIKSPISDAGSKSIFLSLGHPNDEKKCIDGYQSMTVSTHISIKDFYSVYRKEDYAQLKAKWDRELQQIIINNFGDELIDIENTGVGDPKTFEKFTSRHLGCVGGLPLNTQNNVLTFPKHQTNISNFYMIGDTTFPGQGVVGVIQGAMDLYHRLK